MVQGDQQQQLRLWPQASAPLDPTRSYIALFPHLSDSPSAYASSAGPPPPPVSSPCAASRPSPPSPLFPATVSAVDVEPPSPRVLVDGLAPAATPASPGGRRRPHRRVQEGNQGSPHSRESYNHNPVVVGPGESACDLPAGRLTLVHGAAARDATRADARSLFEDLVAFPALVLEMLVPCSFREATLRAHLDIASAMPPPPPSTLSSRPLLSFAGSDSVAGLATCPADRSGSPRRAVSARQDRTMEGQLASSKPSCSLPALPVLDFRQLPDLASMSSQTCSARRQVDSIVSTLSCVRPYMYVTGLDGVRSRDALDQAGVTHILNLAGYTASNFHEGSFVYKRMCPRDDADEDLSVLFDDIAEFVDDARRQGGAVVIHCHMGISRGCAAAAAYLMMDEGLGHEKALRQVSAVRPVSEPNSAFVDLLVDLEHRIRRGLDAPVLYRVQAHRIDRDPHYMVAAPMTCESFGRCASAVPLESERLDDDDASCIVWNGREGDDRVVGQNFALENRCGWILATPGRSGVYALRGVETSTEMWRQTREKALQMGRQEERYEAMFPLKQTRPAEQVQVERKTNGYRCLVECYGRDQFERGTRFILRVLKLAMETHCTASGETSEESVCFSCCLLRKRRSYHADSGCTPFAFYAIVAAQCCLPSGSLVSSCGDEL